MKIVADDKIPFLKGVLEPYCEILYLPGNKINKNDLLDVDALITRTRTNCNESLLSGTKVKCITTATIGFDHVDTDWCEKNSITWTNASGCNSGSVYQYIASLMINLSKKYKFNFSEKKLGVIGVGNVGAKIVKLGKLLGFDVYQNDPPRARVEGQNDFVTLDKIINECGIITCHTPLNHGGIDKTFHLFDEEKLNNLKSGAILINSSRGEIVDNKALKKILEEKKIKSGNLDVWENEPDIDNELVNLLDYVTPHIAGYSADGKANGTAMSVNYICKFFGLALNNWFPQNIPLTSNNSLTIDCSNKKFQEIISEVILFTYDISEDDKRLRASLGTFEKQRGDYPIRREFHASEVSVLNNHSMIKETLSSLGFKIK